MKYKVFDVVELLDGSQAIITEINKSCYKVKIIDKDDNHQSKTIKENDIAAELFKK